MDTKIACFPLHTNTKSILTDCSGPQGIQCQFKGHCHWHPTSWCSQPWNTSCTLLVKQAFTAWQLTDWNAFPQQWPCMDCFHGNGYSPYCLQTTGRRNSRSHRLLATQMCDPAAVSSSCKHTLSTPAQTTSSQTEVPCTVSIHSGSSPLTLP